ncbi:MAG: hypothetical protein V2A66_02725 [Pseudomonadota bacterium]
MTIRFASIIAASILIVSASLTAHSYRLPPYSISDSDRAAAAEDVLSGCRSRIEELGLSVDLIRLEEHSKNSRVRLAGKERSAAKPYNNLKKEISFWEQVVALKKDIIGLPGSEPSLENAAEADAIAKTVIETLYTLSQKWKIGNSALFNNFLINIGAKQKGFCWHYVDELRKALSSREWQRFDIRRGVAWDKDFRENNALVITAKDRPFKEGLAIDPWRTAGRPFWTPVKGDRFPWKEAFGVEVE